MREIPRYIGNRPQASLLHRDILTELRTFFSLSLSLLPKQTPMYVRNTHTHTHPAIGTFHYTSSLHASPCRLLGLLGYTISELQPIALCTRQVLSSTYTSSCYLSLPYLSTGSTSHLPHKRKETRNYIPQNSTRKAKISHILV